MPFFPVRAILEKFSEKISGVNYDSVSNFQISAWYLKHCSPNSCVIYVKLIEEFAKRSKRAKNKPEWVRIERVRIIDFLWFPGGSRVIMCFLRGGGKGRVCQSGALAMFAIMMS